MNAEVNMAEKTKGAAAPKKTQPGDISKMEAVRRAMAELGHDATRTEIQGFVKERFGTEMDLDVISTYKADIARKAAKAKLAVTKPAVMKSVGQQPSPAKDKVVKKAAPKSHAKPSSAAGGNGKAGGILLKDIQAVKILVATVGAESLKTLIEVLSD
jgi:hypothetical protein